jgi:hypothetical protein
MKKVTVTLFICSISYLQNDGQIELLFDLFLFLIDTSIGILFYPKMAIIQFVIFFPPYY